MNEQPEQIKTIKQWQTEIYAYAISKGFKWRKDQIDTMLLRIHSEVSEAYEAYGTLHFGEELADVFIRTAHLAEFTRVNLTAVSGFTFISNGSDLTFKCEPVWGNLLAINCAISRAGESLRKLDRDCYASALGKIVFYTFHAAICERVDLNAEVTRKHAINLKRPFLHGKPKMRKGSNI